MTDGNPIGVPGHVIHMSLEHAKKKGESRSLARCDCGWEFRVRWPSGPRLRARQDNAIEAHWEKVRAP